MKMTSDNLICIFRGEVRGDCISHNRYRLQKSTTVRELCDYIISTREWGYIGIRSNIITSIFGDPHIEYGNGRYETPLESRFSQEELDSYVEIIDWDGGWSRGDWLLTLKEGKNNA